jgi:hypothetical protein
MKTATALITVRGSGHVNLYMKDGETIDDLLKMDDDCLAGRIVDFMDVVNNCIDDDDIEFDDITESKP